MPEHKKGLTWTTQDLTKAGRGVMGKQPNLAAHSEILESFDTLTAVNGSWNVLGTLPALQSSPNIGAHSSCVFLSFMVPSGPRKKALPKGARGIKCRLSDVHTQLSNENKLT